MSIERRPIRTFKPRRRSLSPHRAAAMDRLGPAWLLDDTGPVIDLRAEFGRASSVVLDIGFGIGDTLIEMACAEPQTDVIGCDVHTPGIASTLARIEELGLDNVRLVHGDALVFLERIEPAAFAGARIFFPDPWPKVRQRHRRLVRTDVVACLVDRLVPGGWIHLATDIDDYSLQMQQVWSTSPSPTPTPSS